MNKTDSSERPADGGFLSRWSRRKAQVQQGLEPAAGGSAAGVAATSAAGAVTAPSSPPASLQAPQSAQTPQASSRATVEQPEATGAPTGGPAYQQASAAPQPPQPTLQDVEQLDAASDYRAFVARDVDPQVRNAAFKKLFHSDPHFNVMDGLDVYIDDYNTPNPLPVAVMKTLVQARALGLIDDELKEQDLPPPDRAPVVEEDADATAQAHPHQGEPAQAVPPEHDVDGEPRVGEEDSGSMAPADSDTPRADVVHLLHVEPVEAVNAGISVPALAESPPAAPGNVLPFPRRPGSAGPA